MKELDAERVLRNRIRALLRRAPEFAEVERVAGRLAHRTRPPGFAALVRILVGQQLSTTAAATIYGRLEALGPVTPELLLAHPPEVFRAIGFSGQKAKYCRLLAEAVASGALDLDEIAAQPDDEAVLALTVVKGIGRWTAEIYLLFSLDRPDVFPAADIGLAAGYAKLARRDERPPPAELAAIADAWRPHRSTAARLLWHYYDRMRSPIDAAGEGASTAPPSPRKRRAAE
jgi:DNA-3-methyladenine glycosylase II